MKKDTLYKLIIGILLLLNLLQIGFFLVGKKPPPPNRNQGFDAVKILHLDKQQADQFLEISISHHEKMVKLQDLQKLATEKYFKNPTEAELAALKNIQSKKLKVTNEHYEEVKGILKPEQLPYFHTFKEKALQIIIN